MGRLNHHLLVPLSPTGVAEMRVNGQLEKRLASARSNARGAPGPLLCGLVSGLLLLTISGCTESPRENVEFPNAASLQAPDWQVGDQWSYTNESGGWQNWTVVAWEEYRGLPAYRIEVQYSEPADYLGYTSSTVWVDRGSLGYIGGAEPDGAGVSFDPPNAQVFPMVNRTYDVAVEFRPQGTSFDVTVQHRVHGWTTVSTPSGIWQALHITDFDEELDDEPRPTWFAPEVGNIVQFIDEGGIYRLSSWSRS